MGHPQAAEVVVAVTIDTEEDNWGSYEVQGATTDNILELPGLQETFDRWSVHPTYLVNRPPLVDETSLAVLRALASNPAVEIGAHCHLWHTPPITGRGVEGSMMYVLSSEENQAKIRHVTQLIEDKLGIRPTVFRAGRWGFGATVAAALVEEGYEVDCSITPFIDWAESGGPDFSDAPFGPFRFDPDQPLKPDRSGRLLQLPPTIGFLWGPQRRSARIRTKLEGSVFSRRKIVGLLDRLGVMQRRWLSPEGASGSTMIRLSDAWVGLERLSSR